MPLPGIFGARDCAISLFPQTTTHSVLLVGLGSSRRHQEAWARASATDSGIHALSCEVVGERSESGAAVGGGVGSSWPSVVSGVGVPCGSARRCVGAHPRSGCRTLAGVSARAHRRGALSHHPGRVRMLDRAARETGGSMLGCEVLVESADLAGGATAAEVVGCYHQGSA